MSDGTIYGVGNCRGTSTEECGEPVFCRGYCARHYYHWRNGHLDTPFTPARKTCAIDNCDSAHLDNHMCHFGDGPNRSRGLCELHYFRHVRGTRLTEPVQHKGFAKLSPADVRKIRRLRHQEGRTLQVIADRYGVSTGTIWKACSGQSWRDVD